ncbi:hypothetical protein [Marinobacter sp. ANT_B65]|uniref:hypothetical protein n=1 Tax=Marinobacter sp. ANT_B65 TaxID=2039467 RepID=UPI000BBE34C0|nr:hypothetical protein [Marinobacter sp. ANT_B65]PCM44639.1 hypothetical protein CPA50_00890 [Marinobacter sp. ANT_B65]
MSPSTFPLRRRLKGIGSAASIAWLGAVPVAMAQTLDNQPELLSPLVVTGTALKVEAPIVETPPGGVINAISKRPTEDRQGEVIIEGGTNDHQKCG